MQEREYRQCRRKSTGGARERDYRRCRKERIVGARERERIDSSVERKDIRCRRE